MARRIRFTDAEWAAYADGAYQAEAKRPLSVPEYLTPMETRAFREGFHSKCEEMMSQPVALEIQKMLGGSALKRVLQEFLR
jgi:hypothetical protein